MQQLWSHLGEQKREMIRQVAWSRIGEICENNKKVIETPVDSNREDPGDIIALMNDAEKEMLGIRDSANNSANDSAVPHADNIEDSAVYGANDSASPYAGDSAHSSASLSPPLSTLSEEPSQFADRDTLPEPSSVNNSTLMNPPNHYDSS